MVGCFTVTSLKLVAFERYLLADDRPSHPMTFRIKLRFSGRFDASAFRNAVEEAIGRHPLLHAHLSGNWLSRLRWVPAPDVSTYLDMAGLEDPLTFPGCEQIDLGVESGVRIWVRTSQDATDMRFQFHHACCDGIGAYRLVEDLLCAYDQAVYPHANRSEYRPLDAKLLVRRTHFGLSWTRLLLRLPQEFWGMVVGTINFLVRRPVEILTPHKPTLSEEDRLRLVDYPARTLDERTVRDAAKDANVTLNDLIMRDLFLAVQEWNGRHDPVSAGRTIRIMIPVDLRGPGDEQMPAANVVGMVFLDRRLSIVPDVRRLLKSISWGMRVIKAGRFALAFVRMCGLVELIPGAMRLLAGRNRCHATTVLSNGGRPLEAGKFLRRDGKILTGDLVLETVESAPPGRPGTTATFSCLSYAGQFKLILNYDRNCFTPRAAQALLDTVAGQIQETSIRSERTIDSQR